MRVRLQPYRRKQACSVDERLSHGAFYQDNLGRLEETYRQFEVSGKAIFDENNAIKRMVSLILDHLWMVFMPT